MFNDLFTDYTVTDISSETDAEGNIIVLRQIESDSYPSHIRFSRGEINGSGYDGTEDALLEVLYLNNDQLVTEEQMFQRCHNLTKVEGFTSPEMHKTNHMFCDCYSLVSLDVSNFDTSNVTKMMYMFANCNKLTSLDVSNFDTSNVTSMKHMFYNCNNLTSLDVSNFDTSNVTRMDYMFHGCQSLTSLDVSNFNTNNVTNTSYMFNGCQLLASLDVSNWNTSKVTDMSHMFRSCPSLTTLDVSNFNTSNVTNMGNMFYGCTNLTSLDVSNFNTEKVTDIQSMFQKCSSLTTIGDVSNWDTSNITDMQYMFGGCNVITTINLSNWNVGKVTTMRGMFSYCYQLASLDVSGWQTGSLTDIAYLFRDCYALATLDVSNFDTSKVTDMQSAFHSCRAISLDLSNFNTSNVTNMSHMFCDNTAITSLDVSNFDTTKVTNIQNIFTNCTSLEHIALLYCNEHTVATIYKNLPPTTIATLWLEDTDPEQFYDVPVNATLKKCRGARLYIPLSTPLLKGDRLEVINGQLFHYHKMGKVVLDGSDDEKWVFEEYEYSMKNNNPIDNATFGEVYCDIIPAGETSYRQAPENKFACKLGSQLYGFIVRADELCNNANEFKAWLSNNPTTVVYELENPYYELIPTDTSFIIDIEDQAIIEHSSSIPIITQSLSYREELQELKPSTTYRISFTADTVGQDIKVTLGGISKALVSALENTITITTSSTLFDNFVAIDSLGYVSIDNVVITEGDYIEPYFEGLHSSFEDNKAIITNVYSSKTFGKGGR